MRKSKPASVSRFSEPRLTKIRIFASLAEVKTQLVPYSKDIADNRRKYGESMLRKAEEHLAAQRQHEAEAQARLEAARRKRQEEKEKQEAAEVSSCPLFGIALADGVGCTIARASRKAPCRSRKTG